MGWWIYRGRAGTKRQEVDVHFTVGDWQAEEFSPPGWSLLALSAWAGERPGLEG